MSQPSTLLELAGLHPKTDLNQSILILIDYQNEYVDGGLPLFEVAHAVSETKKLLERARSEQIPVIHVIHRGSPGGLFDLAGHGGEIIPTLAPVAGEAVIEKTLPNSFAGTTLDTVLRTHSDRKNLLVAGLMTHMCLSATVTSAVDHGYFSTVVASTTTTRDLRAAGGDTLSAAQVKSGALATLQDRFAAIVLKPEDLE